MPLATEIDIAKGSQRSDDRPLVSVVMCVYNAGRYLRPALQSVLAQTYERLDIVIVDDGSTDHCIDTIQDLTSDARIRLFRQPNLSRPVALNNALDQVLGEYYLINDADDISEPTRVERQLRAFRDRPGLAAVYSGHTLIMDDAKVAPIATAKTEHDCKRDIAGFHMPGHDPTGMYRMSLVGTLRYNENLPFVEAYDYVLRIGERHEMIVLGEVLYGYRILPGSVTRRDPERRQKFVVDALKAACSRRGLAFAEAFPQGASRGNRSKNSAQDNNLAAQFIESVLYDLQAGRRLSALRTGLQCVRLQPLDAHYYKALVYALGGPGAVGLKTWIKRAHQAKA